MLYPSIPLSDAICGNPALIPVVARFGIRLGLGEKTIADVAAEHGVDAGFFTVVLNTFLDEDYFPEKKLRAVERTQIIRYLHRTNHYYLDSQLPNIERHLRAFAAHSRVADNSPELLLKLFGSFRDRLTAQIEREESEVFPALSEGGALPRSLPESADGGITEPLAEMRNILVRRLEGEYDMNLCHAVVFALDAIERDIVRHDRIRDRVLYRSLRSSRRWSAEHDADSHSKELTKREAEVLRLVVRGKINRQIAEELHISFQTVLSHRKNITAKLGIKTISDLTVYAMMHGYL